MSIKDLPHVTVEQVLALRKAAIELEKELSELKASLPKVRADAVLSILQPPSLALNGDTYADLIKRHALKILEQGNE